MKLQVCPESHLNIFLALIFKSFKKLAKHHTSLAKPQHHYLCVISVLRWRIPWEGIILHWLPPQDQLYGPDSRCLTNKKTLSGSFGFLEDLSLKILVVTLSSASSCSFCCRHAGTDHGEVLFCPAQCHQDRQMRIVEPHTNGVFFFSMT